MQIGCAGLDMDSREDGFLRDPYGVRAGCSQVGAPNEKVVFVCHDSRRPCPELGIIYQV